MKITSEGNNITIDGRNCITLMYNQDENEPCFIIGEMSDEVHVTLTNFHINGNRTKKVIEDLLNYYNYKGLRKWLIRKLL